MSSLGDLLEFDKDEISAISHAWGVLHPNLMLLQEKPCLHHIFVLDAKNQIRIAAAYDIVQY